MSFIFGWGSKNPAQLLAQLQCQPTEKWEAETDALTYLASHSNPQLEEAMKNRLNEANISLLASQLLKTSPQLLDTCLKILSLDALKAFSKINDVSEYAKDEAVIWPKPKEVSLSSRIISNLTFKPGVLSKAAIYVTVLLTWTYSIDINNPPKNNWTAQNQWMFFRSMVSDVRWIAETLHSYLGSVKKTAAVGLALLGAVACLKVLYNRYNFNTVPVLNPNIFQELTTTTNEPSIGRIKDAQAVIKDICVPPGIQPNIPILIGPPGVGKTQFVQDIANMINNGEIPRLSGKRVYSVNAASLIQHGNWSDASYSTRLESLFQELEGKEAFVILFFDEIHNAASTDSQGHSGNVLETLKTKLIEKNILCVLATTQEEFDKYIKPNKAMLTRIDPLIFSDLDDDITKRILVKRFLLEDLDVEVEPAALDEVLLQAHQQPKLQEEMNPRKSILLMNKAMGDVYGWIPKKYKAECERLEAEINTLQVQHQQLSRENPRYREIAEHKTSFESLKMKKLDLKTIREKMAALTVIHQQFVKFKDLQKAYKLKYKTVVHKIAAADQSILPSEKELLWTQFVVLPALNQLVKDTIAQIKKDHNEDVPEKVTPELIRSLFPVK